MGALAADGYWGTLKGVAGIAVPIVIAPARPAR
jgi:hypothetical protein